MQRTIKLNKIKTAWVNASLLVLVPLIIISAIKIFEQLIRGNFERTWMIMNIVSMILFYVIYLQQSRYNISIFEDRIDYCVRGFKKESILIDNITCIEVQFQEIKLKVKDGSEEIIDLNAAKDEPLKEIKEAFKELKEKLENV